MTLKNREFSQKKQELDGLAKNIDIWMGTPMTDDKKERVNYLFKKLNKQLTELDCQYLLTKLTVYKEIYEELKK